MAKFLSLGLMLSIGLAAAPAIAQEVVDEDAAFALAKKGNCFKCHAINKRKKAPGYAEVARKYRDKPDAEMILYKHITGEPVVKLVEGDEPHAKPPTKDDTELYNLIRWILSRSKESSE